MKTDGEPKISYLKLYFIDTVIPEYNDFTRWAEEKKALLLKKSLPAAALQDNRGNCSESPSLLILNDN